MYGKIAKDHAITGPQRAGAAGASSRPLSKTHSIPIQRAFGNRALGQLLESKSKIREAKPAKTEAAPGRAINALPDRLKGSLELLSGMDLSDVRVHRNSSKPAELKALAYTQGRDIHLGPGQDEHLPHEAWHAVQQMQGRVKPTMQARGVPINDDAHLEHEADRMVSKVAGFSRGQLAGTASRSAKSARSAAVAQRKLQITGLDDAKRKSFVKQINDGSALEYELDGKGFLQQKDKKKTATDEYSKQMVAGIADAQTVVLRLVSEDDKRFIDSFADGLVDYDDMKSLSADLFRNRLLHFVVERYAIPDYEKNKSTTSNADFLKAHKKGNESIERQMKEWFPKKTIKYKSEGFDQASKVVDKAGNGSIDYIFDYTDVQHVFKQPIVGGVTKENIISSKIVVK
jgi:hypothetical protein